MATLSDTELEAILSQQIQLAKSHDRSNRATPRAKALDYYFGEMDQYVPPEPNRSKVVSRDVADTIGWILPQLMRVFTASGRMAVAEPVEADDTQFADQATDGMNYVFWKDNKGYEIVYSATWDSLLHGNGIVKTFYDDTPTYATSFHSGLTEDQRALLVQDDDVEVLAQTERVAVLVDPESGQPIQIAVYDLKIKRKKLDGKFTIIVIPVEEFLIDADAVSTDEAAFTDHWQRKTRSDLIGMGYDKDEVWALPEAGRNETPEEQARRLFISAESTDKSMQLVDYHECFIRVDVDGDGEAELVRACYGGGDTGTLLDWEIWEDEHPFDDIPCEPIPHRWDARSVADEEMDVQDVKTVLTRQVLNNLYWVNNPQRFATGKIRNPDALDAPVFGQTVFGDIGSTVTDLTVPYIGDKALMGINYMDEVSQRRTGVGRQSMALDPDTLQNQTATAAQQNHDASVSQHELVARNMAEWGWSKVFRKLMRLMIKHQDQPRTVMLNSKKELTIDPRYWNADMNVTINVGLGTGSRDRDLAMLGQVLQTQLGLADRFMAAGATDDAIELLPKIILTMVKMAESAGIRNPEDYYPEYTEDKVEALKKLAAQNAAAPDPQLAIEAAKGEVAKSLKEVDAQVSMNEAETKAQGDIVKNQAELDADLQTAAADRENALVIAQQKAEHDYAIATEKTASAERIKYADLEFERYKLDATNQLERERMAHTASLAAMKPAPTNSKPA